ncbi:MAG: hypothetical protein R3291_03465, partial [Thermoplasmata archaeon]|nr:hypothetical protein [Thermoplasmata archaeon]
MHFAIVLLVFALFLASAPAGGQSSMERPTYAAGDFWAYDMNVLTEFEFPENVSATFDLGGNATLTIQGSEMRNIRGDLRSVYRATNVVEIGASGSVSLDFAGNLTNATFSAAITADQTLYLDTEGLEVWEQQAEFAVNVSAELELAPGVTFSLSIEANGTADLALNYTTDTWGFPITVGQTGEEHFNVTASTYFEATFLGNTTSAGSDVAFEAASTFEALREETVTVEAGQFTTVVVSMRPGTEETPLPTNATILAYGSAAAGAPVRYAATNDTGEEQVELV